MLEKPDLTNSHMGYSPKIYHELHRDYYNRLYRDDIGIMEKNMEATSWVMLQIMGPFW